MMKMCRKPKEVFQADLLRHLREAVADQVPVLDSDYITTTKKCNALLLLIRKELEGEAAGVRIAELGVTRRANLITVMDVMLGLGNLGEKEASLKEDPTTAKAIPIAAKVFQSFLEQATHVAPAKPFD
ncbi:hypothetical protein G7Y89_g13431 [Cudoniella acicularis]|uniref:Uncharacterized protein n=1 Tax=Cudoniella acicularis TaxID=354080 RepID=A0A8H4R9B9_9HELO|nr:hypothetical protein G7Y89_g13431 [Cudoniella acicularis]